MDTAPCFQLSCCIPCFGSSFVFMCGRVVGEWFTGWGWCVVIGFCAFVVSWGACGANGGNREDLCVD